MAETVYATLTSKGQLTVPREFRDEWGLKAGDQIGFSRTADGKATIEPRRRRSIFEGLDSFVVKVNRPVDAEAIAEGVRRAMVRKVRASRPRRPA